jgi:Glycoside hydrolase 97.
MKRILFCILLAALTAAAAFSAPKTTKFHSPDGRISVELATGSDQVSYTVLKDGKAVYEVRDIRLVTGTETFPDGSVKVGKTRFMMDRIQPVVPLKFSTITAEYNETELSLGKGVSMLLRVMDNCVAYRFVMDRKGDVEVFDDHFLLIPADGFTANYQTARSFNTSSEEPYRSGSLAEWGASDRKLATSPLLLSGPDDAQLLIGESDLDDYPHLFLTTDGTAVLPTYPKVPLRWEPASDRSERILEEAPYIAKTSAQRSFPWRWVAVTDSRGIIEQTIPAQLSRRSVLDDTSWIHPGQFSWEWWNGAAPFGPDVDFKTGCNTATYKYYADFAAKFGVEYILLDEGWARTTADPFHGNDNLDIHELIRYCDGIGVKIVLWLPWVTVYNNFDTIFKTYAEWGVPAMKIDFMDHADQWMVNFYKKVTAEAAKYHIVLDWHGAFTPAGLEYEYPNLLSYEGVLGLENMERCTPANTVWIPFIRNAAGAADFTPGGMNNMQPERFRAMRPNSGAPGTRAFNMALYVILESGVQMLCDNPTRYYQNEDCTRYIASVPTTWDETRALAAKAGEYVIVAKRKGNKWFIGGITNGTERNFTLKLDFLSPGRHQMTAFQDGVNAGFQAMHYNKVEKTVDNKTTIDIRMARNGGWAAVIE